MKEMSVKITSDTLSSIHNFSDSQSDQNKQIKKKLTILRTIDEDNLITNKLMCGRS